MIDQLRKAWTTELAGLTGVDVVIIWFTLVSTLFVCHLVKGVIENWKDISEKISRGK